MNSTEVLGWKEEFNVGVDYIDRAHKRLFGVLLKMVQLLEEDIYEKNKHACMESMKFLKNYTITHFAEEEAYQLEIGYSGYEMHKKLHDNLRDVTLPMIERQLEEKDYSQEVISQAVGIFAGWLTGHIIIEDRAITGRAVSKWKNNYKEDCFQALDRRCKEIMDTLFGMHLELYNSAYEGRPIREAYYYEFNYANGSRLVLIAQKKVILRMVNKILGSAQEKFSKPVQLAYVQMLQNMAKDILSIVMPDEVAEPKSQRPIDSPILEQRFQRGFPQYSIMWKTPFGFLTMCAFV